MDEIVEFMKTQCDSRYFVVRERFCFWTTIKRKPAETIQELAARIRQGASTCDFASIKNPLDEAMRTCFLCAIKDEAILKAVFKVKEDELTFSEAISVASEVEDATRVAKGTVYGSPDEVHRINNKNAKVKKENLSDANSKNSQSQACSKLTMET